MPESKTPHDARHIWSDDQAAAAAELKDRIHRLCLEDSVSPDIPRQLDLTPEDLFICRDLALDDTSAANTEVPF